MGLKQHFREFKSKLYLEGAFSFANTTLLTGIFLVGFALALGADNFQLGVLMAIPLFANLIQLFSAFILEATGTKKYTTFISLFLGRIVWVIVILMAFGFIKGYLPMTLLIIVLIASNFFIAIGSLSLLSWMKDLIPIRRLGRFLGKRNIYASIGGIAAYLGGAYFIDKVDGVVSYGYLFLFALIIGLIALFYLKSIPEKKSKIKAIHPTKFFNNLILPFRDSNFRPLLYFGLLWGLAINIAGPFFIVFMLDDLSLSFVLVSIFLIVDALFRVYGLSIWRGIADKFGAKPTLIISATMVSLTPFWFIFINIKNYLFLFLIFIASAVAFSGVDIAVSQVLFKSAPRKHDAYYLAAFTSFTGLISGFGPILGGLLAVVIKNNPALPLLKFFTPLKFVFLVSFILRTSCIPLISRIIEPKAREVSDVIKRMKTLRFFSFFTNLYSFANHTSKIVLIPEKQLFTLQRETFKAARSEFSRIWKYRKEK